MKKGFTMIELIFVIVILGILASVAIPRIAGTKEDAEISSGIANVRTILSDITSYFAVKGNLTGAKWRDFTNVPLQEAAPNGADIGAAIGAGVVAVGNPSYIAVGGKNCLRVLLRDMAASTYISLSPVAANNNGACAKVLESDLVKPILKSTLTQITQGDGREYCTGVQDDGSGAGCIEIAPNHIY